MKVSPRKAGIRHRYAVISSFLVAEDLFFFFVIPLFLLISYMPFPDNSPSDLSGCHPGAPAFPPAGAPDNSNLFY
jgi:hypothetical protein